jgi:very-short-patch-repair endonuclease
MPIDMPSQSNELLAIQSRAIACRQDAGAGINPRAMRTRMGSGRWQRLQWGVYAVHSGEPARETMLWAALLRAGPGAVLSHQTAAVERPHGLPAARRQARIRQRTGNRYLDNLYEEYGVCSELDGTAAHPADEQWRDKRRDNANAVQGIVTLRFGLADLGNHRCETAAAVAAVLRLRGWTGTAHPCSRPGCCVAGAAS